MQQQGLIHEVDFVHGAFSTVLYVSHLKSGCIFLSCFHINIDLSAVCGPGLQKGKKIAMGPQ